MNRVDGVPGRMHTMRCYSAEGLRVWDARGSAFCPNMNASSIQSPSDPDPRIVPCSGEALGLGYCKSYPSRFKANKACHLCGANVGTMTIHDAFRTCG